MSKGSFWIGVGLTALAAATPGSAWGWGAAGGGIGRGGPHLDHIFVIMLENHSQSSVIGDANAPFLNSLAQSYAVAGNYYGVTHPSLPNYVAAISGSNWFVNDDDPNNRFDHTNLVDQLEASHHTWGAYMESLQAGDPLADYWPDPHNALYASKHNPFVLFDDIRNDPDRMANVKPYSALAGDLQSPRSTPDFVWISPNQCHDMHGGVTTPVAQDGSDGSPCPYGSANDDANDAALKQKADDFVKGAVKMIMNSPAWHIGRSAIIIVTDENDYTGNPDTGGWETADGCCDSPMVPSGVISPTWPGGTYGGGLVPAIVVTNRGGRTGGYLSMTPYNHYSLLATIEENWGLARLGNASDAAQVTTMDEFFTH